MRLDGSLIRIDKDSDQLKFPDKNGQKSTFHFSPKAAQVDLSVKNVSKCKLGEECGGVDYEGTISVVFGQMKEKISVWGECGN